MYDSRFEYAWDLAVLFDSSVEFLGIDGRVWYVYPTGYTTFD